MVNKKVVIIVSIFTVIIVSAIVYFSLISLDKQYPVSGEVNEVYNIQKNENIEKNNNIQKNEIKQENNIEKENEVEEPANETSEDENETSEVEKEKNDGDEKAITLVKKEWGEKDDTVYYNIEEQISDNVYIVSVRDKETTEDLAEYRVDIKQKKVKKD